MKKIGRSWGYWSLLPGINAAFSPSVIGADQKRLIDLVIPTTFESGHFYANPELTNGKRMRMLLDTGGGGYPTMFISQLQADRLGMKADHACEADGRTHQVASPAFAASQALPDLSEFCRGVIIAPADGAQAIDGQIVPAYFKGGTWTFDYPKRQVLLWVSGWHPPKNAHRTALGFKRLPEDRHGAWPRITVRVDGKDVDMLLDTGATAKPTPEGLKEIPQSVTDGISVGSYIVQSTMRRWQNQHPEWKVVANGDAAFPPYSRMIRVPDVEIAGWHVGPVWFIERPDSAFHSMMAAAMDKRPDGAIGANVFQHFRMTIDYKQRAGWFECVQGCSASAVLAN